MPGPLACCRAPSEVQCGVSGKQLTEGGKTAACWHILTGLWYFHLNAVKNMTLESAGYMYVHIQ